MSCKSAIYVAAPAQTTITTNATQTTYPLPLGSVQRRFGCDLNLSGNNIQAFNSGYYDVCAFAVIQAVTAGDYTVTLYKDNQPVAGAFQTITAAANDLISFNIPAIVRTNCCGAEANLSLVLTTTAAAPATIPVINTAIKVERI